MTWIDLVILVVKCIVLSLAATTIFAYFTLFERRTLARLQNRVGPNRAGPGGFLQPLADAVKLFFKEDVTPLLADRWVYLVSPAFALIPAIIIWATIPVGMWPDGEGDNWLQLAEINVGVLYLLAVTSVGVYGIAIAGWASNNKYSMLGGIRASAQVISYELALGLTVLGAVMQAQSFSTAEIVERQTQMWNIVPQFLGFVVFIIAATAEVVRAPFDLVEAEQELVGGYNTEYSSMKFALFFMSEYVKLVAMNAIAVTLFLGGWHFPGLQTLTQAVTQQYGAAVGNAVLGLTSLGAFLLKVLLLSFVSVWIRATLPRVRYDQLMNLGWKVLLPLALINVAITAVLNVLLPDAPVLTAIIGLVAGIMILAVAAIVGRPGKEKRTVKLVEISA
ncbi:NADH-quinone oxidoreductase subunit NuoH [Roseiflexus castenholzii]|jgi:NADH-quinone oxidoreductase subunit H|uniref:NADH-quinone oxidoreductase subunit H n=1 Tax=Roseiflexus castenholzii (strain DSM 13941 / HLO8) TaxID=383372 RepID=A7NPE2_ROSCS|nr:NADH-quinone oxidoreductase subunit NuoH [Roseiflexus castenholzii]ABU59438.1 NADH dehydrogenase (quinone) [Roseiflexus castenholzii DSM 13941]